MLNGLYPEVKDLEFVEKNLNVRKVQWNFWFRQMTNAFKKPSTWEKVSELEQQLKQIP